jgi:hypothetical protein
VSAPPRGPRRLAARVRAALARRLRPRLPRRAPPDRARRRGAPRRRAPGRDRPKPRIVDGGRRRRRLVAIWVLAAPELSTGPSPGRTGRSTPATSAPRRRRLGGRRA